MSREVQPEDNYGLKIVKLLPAEATAAYAAINTALKDYNTNFLLLVLCAAILAVACYFLISWQTNSRRQAIATSIAFVIWAASISAFIYADAKETAILGGLLALATFFLPRFVTSR